MGFGKTERKKERNSRKNKRKKEREEEKKIINPAKWKSVNGTRVFLNATWMYVLNLLQLYIRHKTT